MRRLLTVAVSLLVSQFPLSAEPANNQEPYIIHAINELTGPNAFTGQGQVKALTVVEGVINRTGGIRGRPVKIVVSDDQSDPRIALQLATDLAAAKVPFFFGTGNSSTCNAVQPLIVKNGPLMICGSPGLITVAASYGIASGPTLGDVMLANVRYFRERGWTHLGVLASTDGSGNPLTYGLQYALSRPENKSMHLVALEYMNPTDISVAGPLARIAAAKPDALMTLATGTPWGTMMRGVNDSGLTLPLAGGTANLVFSQLTQYKTFLPPSVYFPGLISLKTDAVGPGPIKDAQAVYFNAFRPLGITPNNAYAVPWDTAMIAMAALRSRGTGATAEQMHRFFMNLHSWAGINGVYDFRDGSQRGIGVRSIVMYRYDTLTETPVP